MIGGLVEHDGSPALSRHLANVADNETIKIRVHGLTATTIDTAIRELRLMARGTRARKPLIHAWASPCASYSEQDWEKNRAEFEHEFGLEGFPCLEVFQIKYGNGGRTAAHVHRVYLRIDIDGKLVRTSHSAARVEKVSRISEVLNGERLTSGRFNDAVITRLRTEGRLEIADAMIAAGLDTKRAKAAPTSAERAASARLVDLAPDEVWRRAQDAWRRSDSGSSFKAALEEVGLKIAMGESCPVVISPGGCVHPLLRAINQGGERASGKPIRKADLAARLSRLILPSANEIVAAHTRSRALPALQQVGNWRRPPTPNDESRNQSAPLASPDRSTARPKPEVALKPQRQVKPQITREQLAALEELDDALHSTADQAAKAIRAQIEAEVTARAALQRRTKDLKRRIADERAGWELPAIGEVGWRDAYRAELANLPKQFGPLLRWVDKIDGEKSRAVLKSGTEVTLTPTHARASASDFAAIPVLVAHAVNRGWKSVTITARSLEWRVALAQAAAKAGMRVLDEDLTAALDREADAIQQRAILLNWQNARDAHKSAKAAGKGGRSRTDLPRYQGGRALSGYPLSYRGCRTTEALP